MGILSWLARVTSGKDAGEASFAPDEEVFHGLNMRAAIDTHIAWKDRLAGQLGGNADMLEVAEVGSDDRCSLGAWLYGPCKMHCGSLPEYADLVRDHANFHLVAGNILMNIRHGEREEALGMLNGGDFRRASDMVQLSLVRLYARSKVDASFWSNDNTPG